MPKGKSLRSRPFGEVLDALLGDDELPIALLFRLSDMTPQEMAAFQARWDDTPEERRRVLVRHMADLTEENYEVEFSPVFAFCLSDRSPAVRIAALDGLWDSTQVGVVRPIIDIMQRDVSLEVRRAATAALAHFVMLGVWGQIPAMTKDRVVAALLAQYHDTAVEQSLRRAALEALGAADHPQVATLIDVAYQTGDLEDRLSAVFAMGNSADPQWWPIVRAEMANAASEMRANAARAAGELAGNEAIKPLRDLAYDRSQDVREAAVEALGKIGGPAAKRALNDLLADQDLIELHDLIEEALEEMDWELNRLDLLDFAGDDTAEVDDDDLWS